MFVDMLRYHLFIFIFLFITVTNYGQDFAPVGATWHYSYTETSPPFNQSYILIESVKDTIILGKNAKKLSQTHYQSSSNSIFLGYEFIYSDSNKVYLYKYNKFNLLYDFNAVQGDTIFVIEPLFMNCGGNGDTLIPFLVDSVKLINISGFQKKIQFVTNLEIGWNFGEKFIESIGSNYFLFPTDCVAPPHIDSIRCYSDSLLSYQLVNDCEEIITSIKENTTNLNQYPLQTTVYNTLILPDIKGEVTIYDIQGKLLFSEKIKPTIPVNLKNGIYIVLLKNKDFQHIYKILKL
ncbi:MAG: T9SS type A sorting domain-containing protein [Vicingaceae bacterium]|nr:T9SS type A sorting domain-containing protein [Vicingaceae bacterium]